MRCGAALPQIFGFDVPVSAGAAVYVDADVAALDDRPFDAHAEPAATTSSSIETEI